MGHRLARSFASCETRQRVIPVEGITLDTACHHSLVPDAELVVYEHSSHLRHLEEPEPHLQALRDLVRRRANLRRPASPATP
jgi:pimeloyl-ACP methyl ester carboxylesterase